MKTYPIEIYPQSYILCSDGQGTANVDASIVKDKDSIRPIIPGKRFKGLLKESVQEVLEMTKQRDDALIAQLFGSPSKEEDSCQNGILRFSNFEYKNGGNQVSPVYVQQTAIENGTAKKYSLRNYEVLDFKNDYYFSGEITVDSKRSNNVDINHELIDNLIKDSVRNLRRIGLRRNRGFGKVTCKISDAENTSYGSGNFTIDGITTNSIKIRIEALDPIILAKAGADNNTIYTSDVITGSTLRGIMIQQFLRNHNTGDDFFNAFFDQSLIFSSCTLKGNIPVPQNIQIEKYSDSDKKLVNLFEDAHADVSKEENLLKVKTQKISGYVSRSGGEIKSGEKSYNFHTSRTNRTAGHSLDEDGDIFYFEYLEQNQEWEGYIQADKETLKEFCRNTLPNKSENQYCNSWKTQIGKSKSAQYGSVEITVSPGDQIDGIKCKDTFYLLCKSPLIVSCPKTGVSLPTVKNFLEHVKGIELLNVAASFTDIEAFNVTWKAKTEKIQAFDKGTIFLVQSKDDITIPRFVGEQTELGYGELKILSKDDVDTLVEKSVLPKSDAQSGLEQKSEHEKVKIDAIKDALSLRGQLSNSLISKCLRMFKEKEPSRILKLLLDEKKIKTAKEKLKKVHLLDDLKKINEIKGKYENQVQYKIYWETFFTSLRKRNNAN